MILVPVVVVGKGERRAVEQLEMRHEDKELAVLRPGEVGDFLYRFDDIWINYATYFASPHYYRIASGKNDRVLIDFVMERLGFANFVGLWGIGDLASAALCQRDQSLEDELNLRLEATLAKLMGWSRSTSIGLCQRIKIDLLRPDAVLPDPATGTGNHVDSGMNNCIVVVKRSPTPVTIASLAGWHMSKPMVPNDAMEFWFEDEWHPRSRASFDDARRRAIAAGSAHGFLLPLQFPME